MYVFAQGHNTVRVGIEPRPLAPESETLPLGQRANKVVFWLPLN